MEHILHLGAKAFLSDICPSPSQFKRSRAGRAIEEDEDTMEELGDEGWNITAEDEEVDDVEDFEPGDLLGKVLALITQVFTKFAITHPPL